MAQDRNTEELIIEAAKKIFITRGLAGARMQDIADEAGINKAMLHYYYRSKDKLFEIVFNEAIGKVIGRLGMVLNQQMPLLEKIPAIIDNYIDGIMEAPYLPMFVLNEINQQPEMFVQRLKSQQHFPNVLQFMKDIVDAGKQGTIREVSPVQLFLNIVSLCVFPFIGRPIAQGILQLDNVQYNMVMEDRKKVVTEVIFAWIKV
ncbi:transcriptional regulator, TetR family [Chitinophaga sp. CF118]|uniref:TetR/AcrR family transcriptional regulator n=1 Tax=Chitinophaga sp. CF118 TaxID=1884367 RepID=UPI0008F2C792|nr:TetR/AcrR family transcriptional regulator [Chitinophaga sp. CF118]SFF03187.1 transcriptional regulator, TetR family [Chitinophaga sp. CF118]